jgi:hypothetical protein
LLAADFVIGDGLLSFRRDKPIDEGLAELFLHVRVPFGIYQHHAVLIEQLLSSAMPQIATELMPHNEPSRRAMCGPPLAPSFVGHASITITSSVRRLARLLADRPHSTGRLSEYPTDYFVGICIETSAVAEQNTLWPPRVDFSDCHLRLLPLEK